MRHDRNTSVQGRTSYHVTKQEKRFSVSEQSGTLGSQCHRSCNRKTQGEICHIRIGRAQETARTQAAAFVERPAQEARKLDKKGLHTMPRQPRKKAVYGGGSLYRPKSDGRYVASFIVEETGQRKYLYADKDDNTERNAYKKLQDALFEQKQGILATGPKQTVEHYLRSWVNDVYKHDVRETTYLKNLTVINSNIIPAIGHVQLRKLAPQHVQSFYTDLIKKGYRSSSVRSIHKLLHKALKNAVRWKLIPFNVCEQVTVPRDLFEQEEVAQALTPVQILSLLRASRDHSLEALIVL